MAREHQVLVIAKNTAGIGARILALFNRRGFNVTKMTSGITNTPGYARITLTVEADDRILDQIQKQIYKLLQHALKLYKLPMYIVAMCSIFLLLL